MAIFYEPCFLRVTVSSSYLVDYSPKKTSGSSSVNRNHISEALDALICPACSELFLIITVGHRRNKLDCLCDRRNVESADKMNS